jgi:hypothetical protein
LPFSDRRINRRAVNALRGNPESIQGVDGPSEALSTSRSQTTVSLPLIRGDSLASPAPFPIRKPSDDVWERFEQFPLAHCGQFSEILGGQPFIGLEFAFYRFEKCCDAPKTNEARFEGITLDC